MRVKSNKLALRVLSTATFLAMVSSCATAAFADTYDLTKGSVTVRAESSGTYVTQTDSDNNYVKNGYGDLLKDYRDDTPTLTTGGKPTDNTASISTEKGVSTTVTLDNVNIDASDTDKAAIHTEGNVTLELDGDNTLTGGEGHAALEKYSTAPNNVADENYTLTLQDETTGDGKTGSLTANGGAGGAGIGGTVTDGGFANKITITGGTVTANGGKGAAGIGGGKGDSSRYSGNLGGGNCRNITISGANTTVTATGGEDGAGIGGGKGDNGHSSGQGFDITIRDGAHVEATGAGGGAGIGGGDGSADSYSSALGKHITITGEGTSVTATGGAAGGAGIGGGKGGTSSYSGQGSTIKIQNGAHVEATGGAEGGAGIGGGKGGTGSLSGLGNNITIQDGAHVKATGSGGGAGIGGGDSPTGGDGSGMGSNITITGEGTTVTSTGGVTGSGIGGGQNGQGYRIDISGGVQVEATGGAEGGAGIGGGSGGYGANITVNDGTVTASGNAGGAGIGGGSGGYGANITVNDGTVTASGDAGGAGIGGGNGGYGANKITVNDGTVTATGSAGGAGIGGGNGGLAQLLTITGGEVTANGGGGGAGIGTGDVTAADQTNLPRAAAIQISGGTVTANGGAEGGAGIGGGKGTAASAKSGGNGVTITDGTVNATGGKGAAGIGSGAGSVWALGSFVDITGGTVTANGGAGEAAGIGSGENDAGVSTVKLSATTAKLDVTAMTLGSGEAISGENGVTMASLTNVLSGVVRFFRGTNHYNTVHNGKYVGMADNNADEHQETDAHIWGSTEIIRQATPTEQGILRHHCAVDGCKGYYEEFFDYVAPAEPVTPAPTDPDTPNVPGTSDSTPGAPAQGTPADAAAADAVPGAATAEEVSVTPSGAQTVTAAALPKTGVNWLAAVGSAISGMVLLAAGYVLDRRNHRMN